MSQEKAAARCSLNTNYYARVERGEINITLTSLEKIARAYSVCPGTFILRTRQYPAEMNDVCAMISNMGFCRDVKNLKATGKFISEYLKPEGPKNKSHCGNS